MVSGGVEHGEGSGYGRYSLACVVLAAIPSPSTGVLHAGPVPLRAYTLMILIGIAVAIVITGQRLRARGQPAYIATDVAGWAVPFGIVGARIYHVVTSPDAYFGADGDPVDVLRVWHGGLGIWGGVAGGALGAWLACRRRGVGFGLFADAVAPGLVLAQAIGRFGNWFNQELYGRPTDLPWALRIDPGHQRVPGESLYHPTFLYESLWNVAVAGVLLWLDRHRRLGRGKLFALYVVLYTAGRAWIEALRIDEAHTFFGVRLNDWTSLVVFTAGVAALVFLRRPVDPAVAAQLPAEPTRTDSGPATGSDSDGPPSGGDPGEAGARVSGAGPAEAGTPPSGASPGGEADIQPSGAGPVQASSTAEARGPVEGNAAVEVSGLDGGAGPAQAGGAPRRAEFTVRD